LPQSALSRMDAGDRFSCAITSAGGLKCWGSASKLGIGASASTIVSTPTDVVGFTSGVAQVSTGRNHACAVTTAGAVKCWGYNGGGVLGNGSATGTSDVPVDVVGLGSGVTMVGAGHVFSCALLATGSVKCWGQTALGNGAPINGPGTGTPVNVTGIADAVQISTGYSHACALTQAGQVKCWGSVGSAGAPTPVTIAGLGVVKAIASGQSNTLALLTNGTVMQWSPGGTVAPALVPSLTDAVQITADYTHACAVTQLGGAKCWGSNGVGQLGRPAGGATGADFVTGLSSGVVSIQAGDWHTCAVLTTGKLKCWGQGSEGQLGNGSTVTFSAAPVDVSGF
jgi:alpha-tubulin suppressor-like RCC1 family protein